MNFGGFYFGGPIEALRNAGFRVVRCPIKSVSALLQADHAV